MFDIVFKRSWPNSGRIFSTQPSLSQMLDFPVDNLIDYLESVKNETKLEVARNNKETLLSDLNKLRASDSLTPNELFDQFCSMVNRIDQI